MQFLADTPDEWSRAETDNVGHLARTGDPAEGGDHLAAVLDVSQAWCHLHDRVRLLLVGRYQRDGEYVTIAAEVGITEGACRKAVSRALERLSETMSSGCHCRRC